MHAPCAHASPEYVCIYYVASYLISELVKIRPGPIPILVIFSFPMQGLHVTISLDTPGPPHQAATWIQLTCLAPAAYHQYFVIYDWTVYCTHRGSEPLGPPLGSIRNDPTIVIRSTPTLCFDTVVCTAHDLVTNSTGQASWIVGPVTGKVTKINDAYSPDGYLCL